jgi:hypothetical protein
MKTQIVKKVTRSVASVFAAAFSLGELEAHDVVWWENMDGLHPANSMELYFGRDWCGYKDSGSIGIVPSVNEPCIVTVNITSVSSPAISAHFRHDSNTGNAVWIEVDVEGLGPATVNATVSGEWHATGDPNPTECDATSPNPFTVPVVIKTPIQWAIMRSLQPGKIDIDTGGVQSGLRWANTLINPSWVNVGIGTKFTLPTSMNSQFFKGTKSLGGAFSGSLSDPLGNPLSGLSVGLPYGGASTTTDFNGGYFIPWLPRGLNLISIGKAITFTDPSTSSNRTENVAVNVIVPATNTMAVAQLKVDMVVDATPKTNACNCTPWCAIGTGNLNGTQTPVYFSGGAFPPQSGPADCDQPQVTVTPPGAAAYTITAGTDLHQNSGANPASGTWTVTTTVCGRSKSCTVTVP